MTDPAIDLSGIRVSNSRLGTWRRCQKKYEFKYVMGLEPRAKKRQLEMGSWMHLLLQIHYTGGDWREKHRELTKAYYELFEEQREELGDLPTDCARLMKSYLRYWKEDDSQFRVIDAELDEVVTLPSGLEFRMIIDLIAEEIATGLIWPWDHKNRSKFARQDNMLIDPQLTNYFSGLEIMGYKPLGGVVYNELRTKAPTVPKILKKGGLSKAKSIDTDVYTYYRAIRKHGLDPNNYRGILAHIAKNEEERFFRRVRLPKDRTMRRIMMEEAEISAIEIRNAEARGKFTRSSSNQCAWDCDFKELCISQLHGGDLKSLIKHGYRRRKESDELEEK